MDQLILLFRFKMERGTWPTNPQQQLVTTRRLNADHSLCVQILDHGNNNDDERHGEDLAAGANERRKDQRVAWRPKHVPMHLLPPVFISQVSVLMVQWGNDKKWGF